MSLHPDCIGCDVSKSHLDFFISQNGLSIRIDNTSEAVSAWLKGQSSDAGVIVFEATGRYDRLLRQALQDAGRPYSRVNPARARDFAKAIGLLAKTDRIDARMLALMGTRLTLPPSAPNDPVRDRFTALQRRRDQLVSMRQKEKQRLGEADVLERESLERHIAWLGQEIKGLEQASDQMIKENGTLRQQIQLLRSIPGIGPVTAAALVCHLPEIGTLPPKALSAMAGLAPFNTDSGRFQGKRSIRGGRKRVRDALYMAAVTAARSNSRFSSCAKTLLEKGKPFKVVAIALARKILTVANAVIRDKTPYREIN